MTVWISVSNEFTRETEKSPVTCCSDANWHVSEHSVAHLLHCDSEEEKLRWYGEVEQLVTHIHLL